MAFIPSCFVVSNATEAGIVYSPEDRPGDYPPNSFPGKLTAYLYRRYRYFGGARDKGLVSTTALTAAGVHLILFTTGRGTPFGAPVPTVKVSTNTALYVKKKNWIDFDAGQLLEGKSMEELSEEFFACIIDVASKNILTKNEQNNYREIAIFKKGVTL